MRTSTCHFFLTTRAFFMRTHAKNTHILFPAYNRSPAIGPSGCLQGFRFIGLTCKNMLIFFHILPVSAVNSGKATETQALSIDNAPDFCM